MWDSLNNSDPCAACQYTRSLKITCDTNDELFLDKENMQSFSSMKNEDLSLYESGNSPLRRESSPTQCPHARRRPLEEYDSNSRDSGYGASYNGENFLSSHTRNPASFSSGSMCSMEEEFLDLCDVEPLENENSNLPQDFNKLISNPLMHRPRQEISPKDSIRPLFRRALSLQPTSSNVTPTNSRVRTSLFRVDAELRSFKRPEPPIELQPSAGVKRSRLFDVDEATEEAFVPVARPQLHRAFSATEESIMCALQRSSTEPDLIGDFSRNFGLPLTKCRHQDLKAISPRTLAELMRGGYQDMIASYKVIDCRYPYEYDGGHIAGAVNLYTKEQCTELLNNGQLTTANSKKRNILVFHCEFSSERGPNLYRYLRKEDRSKNEIAYPSLNFPEVYLLEGGYKCFFEQFSSMCTPESYKQMLHPDHEEDLRYFRQKSKTWNCDSRQRPTSGRSLKRLGL